MEPVFSAAVVTVSDRSFRGVRPDTGGPLLQKILSENGFSVEETVLVPDDAEQIVQILRTLAGKGIRLVATTGGTGFSRRDVTPEATARVCTRMVPGIAEAMRREGMKYTDRAMLSRGICGMAGDTVILNLPGNPKAIAQELPPVLPALRHGLSILAGGAEG